MAIVYKQIQPHLFIFFLTLAFTLAHGLTYTATCSATDTQPLHTLAEGIQRDTPLPDWMDEAHFQQTGFRITPEGLAAAYHSIISGTLPESESDSQWTITAKAFIQPPQEDILWKLYFKKNNNDFAYATIEIWRSIDHVLNLTIKYCKITQNHTIQSEFVGTGFSTYFLKASIALIQSLSSHPESTIGLRAISTEDGNHKNTFSGAYVWAMYGFDVNRDSFHISQRYSEARIHLEEKYGPLWKRDLHFLVLKQNFLDWILLRYASLYEDIHRISSRWQYPWDIAQFNATEVATSEEIRRIVFPGPHGAKLGKEFLLAPSKNNHWSGELLVNQPQSPGMIQYQKYSAMILARHKPRTNTGTCQTALETDLK